MDSKPSLNSKPNSTKPEVNPQRTCNIAFVVFEDQDGFPEYDAPGVVDKIAFGPDFWLLACPGCGRISAMRVGNPKPQKSPSWKLKDGKTLTPSINCTGCCGWHGYLTNGVFTPC